MLILKPGKVTLSELENIYRSQQPIQLDQSCQHKVNLSAAIVEKAAQGEKGVYGVNTGFGKLANTRIASEDTATLQRNLILSHCCGMGAPFSEEIVRLIITLKLISLGRGASGVRWQVLKLLEALLEKRITPLIPCQGSVGASGDLAPLAHLTAVMIGEGQVIQNEQIISAQEAFSQANLEPIVLGPKEGLGMINGTQVSTALALAGMFDAWRMAQTSIISGALSIDALMASTSPFRKEIHQLRGQPGQIDAAQSLRDLLHGSEIRESHRDNDQRVQDPYCVRCQPQVLGACMDLLRQAAKTLEIEANAVTDNPIVIIEDNSIISGGNFHAEPVAFAADQCAIAIAEMGSIVERRIATTVDPAQSYGLPAFLSPNPGLNSGFMIAEVTAAALMSENKHKAAPCSVDSTPTSANQEDHVSMACHGARRILEMNENLASIIGIEILIGCQGIELRKPLKSSDQLQSMINRVREDIAPLEDDRFMANDLNAAKFLVVKGILVKQCNPGVLPDIK